MIRGATLTIFCFIGGIALGKIAGVPVETSAVAHYCLYALMFLVGISMGMNERMWHGIRSMNWRVMMVPACVGIGSVVGAATASLLIPQFRLHQAMAVGAGVGYYSLSSLIILEIGEPTLASIALFSNLSRELLTLASASLMVRYFGRLAPIASGGATSMDITLPIIIRLSGEEYALTSIISGVVLTLLVPVLVPLFMRM